MSVRVSAFKIWIYIAIFVIVNLFLRLSVCVCTPGVNVADRFSVVFLADKT